MTVPKTMSAAVLAGKTLGADQVVDVRQNDATDYIMKETNGKGVEIAIEASGSKEGLRAAVKIPRWMGKILLLGIPKGLADVDFHNLARGNKSLYTVRGEGWTNCRRGVSLLRQKRVDLSSLVTHTFPCHASTTRFAPTYTSSTAPSRWW
jgi:alcohol dehydrogenase